MIITPKMAFVDAILSHARLNKILILYSKRNVPQLGRYVYAEFTGKVPDDYECLVCHLPMKDPVQIVQCGHKFCSIGKESLFTVAGRMLIKWYLC